MSPWNRALREGMFSGACASVLSTLALAAAGRSENSRVSAPVNAISHWFWGDRALRKNRPSLRYTITGYAIHHAASVLWATLHARAWAATPRQRAPAALAASSVAVASAACFVDFRLTPQRLTPGFEHRLSRPAIALVYGCFALGLALGSGVARRCA